MNHPSRGRNISTRQAQRSRKTLHGQVFWVVCLALLILPPSSYADIRIFWRADQVAQKEVIFGPNSAADRGSAEARVLSYVISRMSNAVGGDELSFPPISGNLIPYNTSNPSLLPGSIIAGYFPVLSPYRTHEAWIKDMVLKYSPKAVVLVTMRTLQQIEAANHAVDMSMVNVPVVTVCVNSTSDVDAARMQQVLFNFPFGVNATLDSASPNTWLLLRRSWWSVFQSCVLVAWAVTNVAMAATAMLLGDGSRNMAFVILLLEIVAGLVRFGWALDPYSARYIPKPIVEVFFSSSLPAGLGSIILLAFFWQELLHFQVGKVSGILTRLKIPATVVMIFIVVVEMISACLRAAGVDVLSTAVLGAGLYVFSAVQSRQKSYQNLNFVVFYNIYSAGFFVLLAGSCGYFVYIALKLLKHLSNRKSHPKRDGIIRQFAWRALGAAAGMIGMMLCFLAFLIMTLLRLDSTYYVYFFIHAFANVVSTTQIVSLLKASRKSYKLRNQVKSTEKSSSEPDALS